MIRIATLIALALSLTACASPRAQCLNTASKNLRVLDSLIAQTEANLQRGYAVRTETVPISYPHYCIGRDGIGYFCERTSIKTERRAEAIDLNAEKRKLASLRDKRRELVQRTQKDQALCLKSYPEA